jgi:hypothetical protein
MRRPGPGQRQVKKQAVQRARKLRRAQKLASLKHTKRAPVAAPAPSPPKAPRGSGNKVVDEFDAVFGGSK